VIIAQSLFYDAAAFAEGLRNASRGVLRVLVVGTDGRESVSTGWLITDTLLVIPDYSAFPFAGAPGLKYMCQSSSLKGHVIEAKLVSEMRGQPDGSRPALLRLRESLPGCALSLEVRKVRPDDPIVILQYPGGQPQLQFSLGRMIESAASWVRYDANTVAGSGGAPVLSAHTWTLAGMHVKASHQGFNEGLALPALLDALRESPAWGDIERHHSLVDVGDLRRNLSKREKSESAPAQPDAVLLAAALRWNFNPEKLKEEDREKLRTVVSDPSAPLWSLDSKERQRLIRSAGSLSALRKARKYRFRAAKRAADGATCDMGQQVIDRILKGPPYPLNKVKDEELPYWLQAVRWFAHVEPELPKAAEVNRTLERRRVRSRLLTVAGPGFRGRDKELTQMRKWYEKEGAGPLVISGIGGIGKSSLIGQFALGLPSPTVLLWLDFDRADLAPDDAESVLSLLCEQAAVQLEDFTTPDVEAEEWGEAAYVLGNALASPSVASQSPLLVLDGFEVAQHAKEHHKIWEVLERILRLAPDLRVVVSGRAAVSSVTLLGRKTESLPLEGMARPDAEAWLRERGIEDSEVLARVVEISRGVPLVLKLAVRWVDEGGKVGELPVQLPKTLVEGFLYQRILDRVIDPRLKGVARDALVLRRLTPEMVPDVLHDTLPPGLDAHEVFALLTREMGIVEANDPAAASAVMVGATPGVLSLRSEVRAATLRLLEMEDAVRVRKIDLRAAEWYAKENLSEAANAAELVYHRLRLGDIEGAEAVWTDECAYPLRYAADELPESAGAERAWLLARIKNASAQRDGLAVWEAEAAGRIRSALGRGLLRAVPEVLGERAERSAASPLVLYDAWSRWHDGFLTPARNLLAAAGEDDGSVGRDRAVLGALLASVDGDRAAADRLLAKVDDRGRWLDRPNGGLEALAVRAARVRLTVDLWAELELTQLVRKEPDTSPPMGTLNEFLKASDVVLPELCRRLGVGWVYESSGSSLKVPSNNFELPGLASQLQYEWQTATVGLVPIPLPPLSDNAEAGHDAPWSADDLDFPGVPQFLEHVEPAVKLGLNLFVLGWRRWHLATSSLFLSEACEQALGGSEADHTLSLSVAATLAAFHGQQMEYSGHFGYFPSLDHVLGACLRSNQRAVLPRLSDDRLKLAVAMLHADEEGEIVSRLPHAVREEADSIGGLEQWAGSLLNSGSALIRTFFTEDFLNRVEHSGLHSVLFYLIGPDPLEALCHRIVGLPDNLKL